MKSIKKSLLKGEIKLSAHAKGLMNKRGHTRKDVIACIMNGSIHKKASN